MNSYHRVSRTGLSDAPRSCAPETLVPPEMKTRTYNYLSESFSHASVGTLLRRACRGWPAKAKIDVPCAYFPKIPAHSHIVDRHFARSDMSNGVLAP